VKKKEKEKKKKKEITTIGFDLPIIWNLYQLELKIPINNKKDIEPLQFDGHGLLGKMIIVSNQHSPYLIKINDYGSINNKGQLKTHPQIRQGKLCSFSEKVGSFCSITQNPYNPKQILLLDAEKGKINVWDFTLNEFQRPWTLPHECTLYTRILAFRDGHERKTWLYLNDLKEGSIYRYRITGEKLVHKELVAGRGTQKPPRGIDDSVLANEVKLSNPSAMAWDDQNQALFVSDLKEHVVYSIDMINRNIRVVLGTGARGNGTLNAPGPGFPIAFPNSLCLTYFNFEKENYQRRPLLFVTDTGNNRLVAVRTDMNKMDSKVIIGNYLDNKINFLKSNNKLKKLIRTPLWIGSFEENIIGIVGLDEQLTLTLLIPQGHMIQPDINASRDSEQWQILT